VGDKAGNLSWNQVMKCLGCLANEHEQFWRAMERKEEKVMEGGGRSRGGGGTETDYPRAVGNYKSCDKGITGIPKKKEEKKKKKYLNQI